MESELIPIPTLRELEKILLDLSGKIRIQSTSLECHIENMEEDGNAEFIVSENEAVKVLERTSSLKDELEKFKLNLKKFQEITKQKRNSSESKDKEETDEHSPELKTDESMVSTCPVVGHPESFSADTTLNGDGQENEDISTTIERENTETERCDPSSGLSDTMGGF
ncbi:uncharacterized protein LOC125668352 isoform X3 [Ostrea edulis]|uniref:uncharacterized protein LOC125668352 isoform X3 n=1 Tax=Ostrea edulis TaxID=37623 RepID=UPI0024AEAF44|nr:uncharacterized protein LOC125668352 isoform X3 [Ostrea edulis]